jgi:hypothetical protein
MLPHDASLEDPPGRHRPGSSADSLFGAAAFRTFLAAIALLLAACVRSPQGSFFLTDEDGARWIRNDDEFNVVGRCGSDETTLFRTQLTLQMPVPSLTLRFKAFRAAAVIVDRVLVKDLTAVDRMHLDEATVALPPLGPGVHELIVCVVNRSAHPALLVACPELGLRTGTSAFESSKDGRSWTPAVVLEDARGFESRASGWTTPAAFEGTWPWWSMTTLVGAVIVWKRRSVSLGDVRRFRFALLVAWLVLSINDLFKLPLFTGMDVFAHMSYVRDVAGNWHVPLADEGWERHQPPLFYFLSAMLSYPLRIFGPENLERSLRLVTLLCGAAQIELAYRYAKLLFESKPLHQLAVIVCAACIPMNIYMSQVVGNEPLAGVLVATGIYFALRMLGSDTQKLVERNALLLGVAMGLACLTKVSTISLLPCLAAAAVLAGLRTGDRPKLPIRPAVIALGTTLLISGWFYARNWIHFGSPFISGWSWRETNQEWWQDPSYRVPAHLYMFGEALVHPINSSSHGLLDSLYSTFWLDGSMSGSMQPPHWTWPAALTMTWLGVPLTLAAIAGCFVPLDPRSARMRLLLVCACLSIGAAIALVYVQFPVYSTGKASYALGLVPAIACLMAAGLSPLFRTTIARMAAGGLLVSALAFSFAAYWIVK